MRERNRRDIIAERWDIEIGFCDHGMGDGDKVEMVEEGGMGEEEGEVTGDVGGDDRREGRSWITL